MLKSHLLSGWFCVTPYHKYAVVAMLIVSLLGASIRSTLAKQLQVVNQIATAEELNSNQSQSGPLNTVPVKIPTTQLSQILPVDENKPDIEQEPLSQLDLAPKLKPAKIQVLSQKDHAPDPLTTTTSIGNKPQPIAPTTTPVDEQHTVSQTTQADPLDSPHPIPWKWITLTQETIGSKGGSGVRYYRSVPIYSPDRKYSVYSRIQLEIQPELYNSRVTSILFILDMQTKRLRVLAKTALFSDPLLKTKAVVSTETDTNGTIGVLVPVSWSEKGDRFLARKFKGIFNTGDATDEAVIWDRQQNQISTVSPAIEDNDHEKIAILLGWSKSQPDHVLFRTGELGDENWPLVKVASNGETSPVNNNGDQPITFGDRVTQIWAEPQVASR
jgi:hypothetical protein